jgi:guanylate kinase
MHSVPEHKLIIITAPSGAGKTSITHCLLNQIPELAFSISATTRTRRDYERDGVDYYFLSEEEFKQKIRDQNFIEWEMVYEGKYYGTLKSELKRIWDLQRVPVLDIDVQGTIHVQQQYPLASLSIFIEPPSIDELKRRLQSRNTETESTLSDRINKAFYEITFKQQFNQIIVNDHLESACLQASQLIRNFLSGPWQE